MGVPLELTRPGAPPPDLIDEVLRTELPPRGDDSSEFRDMLEPNLRKTFLFGPSAFFYWSNFFPKMQRFAINLTPVSCIQMSKSPDSGCLLKSEPFNDQIRFNCLKSGFVRFLNAHCIIDKDDLLKLPVLDGGRDPPRLGVRFD